MKNFIIENGKYGKKLVLCSTLTEHTVEYCMKKEIRELELNWAKGFKAENLSFLENLTELQAFTICDYTINDISQIERLKNLRELQISTYCKTPINFNNFPKLETLSLFWRKGVSGLENLKNLKRLFLYKYNPACKDLSELSSLKNLEYLSLKIPSIQSVGGVEKLSGLKFLGIYGGTKLQNIDRLAELESLQTLEIDTCRKINDITVIGKLAGLQTLSISNCDDIESLKPISKLANLTELRFIESTNIKDGDIKIVNGLPKLKTIMFQDRKHYNLKRTC